MSLAISRIVLEDAGYIFNGLKNFGQYYEFMLLITALLYYDIY